MDNKIDQLKTEVSDIEKSLDELKNNVTLSEADKKTQADTLKAKAEATKQKIENEIHSLENKTDDDSKKKKEEAETLLNSFNETMQLYTSILNTWSTNAPSTTPEAKDDEKKSFFWRAWDWIWEQWDAVRDGEKRKTETWLNILRAWWALVTWVALYKWVKKLWNRAFWKDKKKEKDSDSGESKKDEKKEEKWFWEKPMWKTIRTVWSILAVWSVGYYVAHGIYTQNRWLKDLRDREKGKKLWFEEALNYSKGIWNNKDEKHMAYWMELNYDESTQEIIAYWERIKINKNARKIVWMDVNFKKYEDMICTAILIAYLKKEYSWKCDVVAPFSLWSSWNWNINADWETAVNWTWIWRRTSLATAWWIAWIAAWIFSWSVPVWVVSTLWLGWAWYIGWQQIDQNNVMHNFMPELDNEDGKKSLIWYLNKLNCWQKRNQNAEELTQSPIRDEAYACVQSIESEDGQGDRRWGERKFDAVPDPNNSNRYIFEAYGRKINVEVTWEQWNRKVKILWMMEEWNPSVKVNQDLIKNFWEMSLDEWVRTVCLIWMYLKDYNHWIKKLPAFEYKSVLGAKTWLYLNDWKNAWVGTRVLREDTFKNKFPTLFTKKDEFVKFLNEWINWDNNVSIRKE